MHFQVEMLAILMVEPFMTCNTVLPVLSLPFILRLHFPDKALARQLPYQFSHFKGQ